MKFNPNEFRRDFPVLRKGIIYMDSSCVSLKPEQVVNAVTDYYHNYPACGARSSHRMAIKVTETFEDTRKTISKFLNSKKKEEIILTNNTTYGINIVAHSYEFKKGDKVLISDKEHNSNLIPWQELVKRKGIKLDIFRFGDVDSYSEKVEDAKFVSTVHTSNLDGSSQDIKEMVKIAHDNGAKFMLDGAQGAPHKEIDLKKLNVDFFACSGHKMLGPSGTGIFYGKMDELEKLSPFITGGETVRDSTYESNEAEHIPHKFEAGLQNYAGVAGLREAILYLKKVGLKNIQNHEVSLNKYITERISNISGLNILGPQEAEKRSGIISFTIDGIDPHELALQLDSTDNIMIRSGYHCCHSWFNSRKILGSARASLYLYNTHEEADKFCESIRTVLKIIK